MRRGADFRAAAALLLAVALTACATGASLRTARSAEQAQDYDRRVVEYTRIVRATPANRDARAGLERAKLRAAQEHTARGRRLASLDRWEEAVVEYQLAAELNPTDAQVDAALKDARERLRTKLRINRGGHTDLESLIDRTRDLPAPRLEPPANAKLPASLVFGSGATARGVFTALAKFANLNIVF